MVIDYVRRGLQTSFKNFRRDHLDETSTSTVRASRTGTAAKRRKTTSDEDESMEYDEDGYEPALSDLAEEWSKGRRFRSQAVIKEHNAENGLNKIGQWCVSMLWS